MVLVAGERNMEVKAPIARSSPWLVLVGVDKSNNSFYDVELLVALLVELDDVLVLMIC